MDDVKQEAERLGQSVEEYLHYKKLAEENRKDPDKSRFIAHKGDFKLVVDDQLKML